MYVIEVTVKAITISDFSTRVRQHYKFGAAGVAAFEKVKVGGGQVQSKGCATALQFLVDALDALFVQSLLCPRHLVLPMVRGVSVDSDTFHPLGPMSVVTTVEAFTRKRGSTVGKVARLLQDLNVIGGTEEGGVAHSARPHTSNIISQSTASSPTRPTTPSSRSSSQGAATPTDSGSDSADHGGAGYGGHGSGGGHQQTPEDNSPDRTSFGMSAPQPRHGSRPGSAPGSVPGSSSTSRSRSRSGSSSSSSSTSTSTSNSSSSSPSTSSTDTSDFSLLESGSGASAASGAAVPSVRHETTTAFAKGIRRLCRALRHVITRGWSTSEAVVTDAFAIAILKSEHSFRGVRPPAFKMHAYFSSLEFEAPPVDLFLRNPDVIRSALTVCDAGSGRHSRDAFAVSVRLQADALMHGGVAKRHGEVAYHPHDMPTEHPVILDNPCLEMVPPDPWSCSRVVFLDTVSSSRSSPSMWAENGRPPRVHLSQTAVLHGVTPAENALSVATCCLVWGHDDAEGGGAGAGTGAGADVGDDDPAPLASTMSVVLGHVVSALRHRRGVDVYVSIVAAFWSMVKAFEAWVERRGLDPEEALKRAHLLLFIVSSNHGVTISLTAGGCETRTVGGEVLDVSTLRIAPRLSLTAMKDATLHVIVPRVRGMGHYSSLVHLSAGRVPMLGAVRFSHARGGGVPFEVADAFWTLYRGRHRASVEVLDLGGDLQAELEACTDFVFAFRVLGVCDADTAEVVCRRVVLRKRGGASGETGAGVVKAGRALGHVDVYQRLVTETTLLALLRGARCVLAVSHREMLRPFKVPRLALLSREDIFVTWDAEGSWRGTLSAACDNAREKLFSATPASADSEAALGADPEFDRVQIRLSNFRVLTWVLQTAYPFAFQGNATWVETGEPEAVNRVSRAAPVIPRARTGLSHSRTGAHYVPRPLADIRTTTSNGSDRAVFLPTEFGVFVRRTVGDDTPLLGASAWDGMEAFVASEADGLMGDLMRLSTEAGSDVDALVRAVAKTRAILIDGARLVRRTFSEGSLRACVCTV